AMIRVGNQKGLQNFKELRRIAFSIYLLGLGLAFVFALLFLVFHKVLPNIYLNLDDVNNFKDNSEVIKIAAKLLLAAAVFQLSDSIQVMVLGALRGLQDVKIPTLITFVAYWLIGFPISYFLGKQEAFASFGIWLGLLVGLTAAAIMLYIRFNYLTKRLIKNV
ncbi:MAG: MATE family efflux transporter, partial [Flavobacteriaceae bacterium]|nr:MATE family efflux transporter [Flavobacteriaceae bacterium]